MTLLDEVLAERRRMASNPDVGQIVHIQLSDDVIALCTVLDRRVADENERAAMATLTNHEISQLPTRFADGVTPSVTARAKEFQP